MVDTATPCVIGSVSFSAPTVYTEAHHTAHATVVSGASPIPVPHLGAGVEQHTTAVSAHYHWRTQLAETTWMFGNLHTHGPVGDSSLSHVVIHSFGSAPEWLAEFAWTALPHNQRLVVPGKTVDVSDPAALGLPSQPQQTRLWLADATGSTVVRHTVHGSQITGADVLCVPSSLPGRPDRWMRPREISVVYLLADRPRHVGGSANRWEVHEVRVTGPWVTETGELNLAAPGSAVAPLPPSAWPEWVRFYVDTHLPTDRCLKIISNA